MEFTTEILISLITLTFLEIVLGIDNIVFISIVGGRLPLHQQKKVRIIGLTFALAGRILLLLVIDWIIGLRQPIFTIRDFDFSYRDLILIAGGMFLIAKSTSEMHKKLEVSKEKEKAALQKNTLRSAIIQIFLLDLVFSLDSIITAVGLVEEVWIIMIAIIISIVVMLVFSKAISDFINRHPTMKLLAMAFLLMIGTVLVIEGMHVHVPKGYIYFSMAFALAIELLNMRLRKVNKTGT